MPIVKRITKGSALTHEELDGNFTEVEQQLTGKQATMTKASQAQAEAGADDAAYMTALKTAQAIAALGGIGAGSGGQAIAIAAERFYTAASPGPLSTPNVKLARWVIKQSDLASKAQAFLHACVRAAGSADNITLSIRAGAAGAAFGSQTEIGGFSGANSTSAPAFEVWLAADPDDATKLVGTVTTTATPTNNGVPDASQWLPSITRPAANGDLEISVWVTNSMSTDRPYLRYGTVLVINPDGTAGSGGGAAGAAFGWQTVTPPAAAADLTLTYKVGGVDKPSMLVGALTGASQVVIPPTDAPDGSNYELLLTGGSFAGLPRAWNSSAASTHGFVWLGTGAAPSVPASALYARRIIVRVRGAKHEASVDQTDLLI